MVTIKEVAEEVVKLTKQYPKAIYHKYGDSCLYKSGVVTNGPKKEGCIVGQALMNLGVRFKDEEADAETFLPELNIEFNEGNEDDEYELGIISKIQSNQDKGKPWGKCI